VTTGERIKERRKEIGLSAENVAQALGLSPSTIYRYEKGEIEKVDAAMIEPLARVLNTTGAYLLGWEDPPKPAQLSPTITEDTVRFNVLGDVAAGYDHSVAEDWEGDTIEIPTSYLKGRPRDDYFVLRVKGDSMYPLYVDGDRVLVLKQATLNRSGDIGVILYNNDQATIKKVEYVYGEDWMKLIPLNPNHPPKMITGSDLEQCRVLGIPRLLIREVE